MTNSFNQFRPKDLVEKKPSFKEMVRPSVGFKMDERIESAFSDKDDIRAVIEKRLEEELEKKSKGAEESGYKEGFRKGFEDGFEKAKAEGTEKWDAYLLERTKIFESLMIAIADQKKDVLKQNEAFFIGLIQEIIRKAVVPSIKLNPDAFVPWINELMDEFGKAEEIQLFAGEIYHDAVVEALKLIKNHHKSVEKIVVVKAEDPRELRAKTSFVEINKGLETIISKVGEILGATSASLARSD